MGDDLLGQHFRMLEPRHIFTLLTIRSTHGLSIAFLMSSLETSSPLDHLQDSSSVRKCFTNTRSLI